MFNNVPIPVSFLSSLSHFQVNIHYLICYTENDFINISFIFTNQQ